MKLPRIMAYARPDSPLRVTLYYVLFGTLWIVGSDLWVAWQMEHSIEIWKISTLKGLLFVLATSGMLYVLIRRLDRRHLAAQEALQESQLRWQFALEGAGDGLWDWNAETNRVFFSKRWKAMLGYAEHEIGDSLSEWEDRVHPEDLPGVQAALGPHMKGDTPLYTSEHRVRMKDGTYRWILDRGQIISRAPDGRPLRMLGTHTDITERKSAEARSADSLAFAQAVLHSSPVGVIAYGADGRAVIANESAARIIGTDVPGLLRQNFREIESWRRYGLLANAEQALVTGREVVHSGHYVSSFGRDLWLEVRFMPFTYAGQPHLLLMVTDETERRRTLNELRLMETAVRAAPVGWVVTDPEGVIQWVNPGFTTLTGYTAAEAIGQNPRVLKSGRHSAEFYAAMWATIKGGEVWSGEVFNQRKDGVQYPERMTIAPVHGEDGAVAHYVAIKQDITEQKQLEQQLARAQRLEGIGMLASGIAHDLNNIFAPILLSLELLKVKYPMADARKTLEMIEAAGQRGAGIVRQVLTFARGIEGERTEVQPKYLLKELADILRETLPRNIRIDTELGPALPPVLGDATQLHQVLLNLAINARDAMPAGGRLILGAQITSVDEARATRNPPLKPGPCVALTVTDTGSGITPEVLEHMFEPFFTTKPLGQGTGLGLSTVYGIVRSHGGAIEVNSKLRVGTTFTVLLPALDRPVEPGGSASAISAPFSGGGRRVLVVDDEEAIRLITMMVLERHGFAPEVAVDGVEALELFQKDPQRFAVVITDLMMPRMNGRELVQRIRRQTRDLPIIATTGLTEANPDATPQTTLAGLGVRTFLRKPATEAELLAALQQELEPSRAGESPKE